jgi:hypothetical protein
LIIKTFSSFRRKNPYLFKAKHVLTSEQIIKSLIDAHISSSEEGIFGDWLEGLAIFINEKVYGGRKLVLQVSILNLIPMGQEICNNQIGPNWGNVPKLQNEK